MIPGPNEFQNLKERDDKYDLNQSKAEPWMPNQDDRRVSSMLW